LPFSGGKALASALLIKAPFYQKRFEGHRACNKIRKPCALQTALGSLDIMGCIMSPCLLAKTLIALFFGPAGSLPVCPQGLPKKKQLK
jgi:hypothetical protein